MLAIFKNNQDSEIKELPVPKSLLILSSEIIGRCSPVYGCLTLLPIKWEYLESLGFTAMAESPSIVSNLVVAIKIFSSEKGIILKVKDHISLVCSYKQRP